MLTWISLFSTELDAGAGKLRNDVVAGNLTADMSEDIAVWGIRAELLVEESFPNYPGCH